MKVTMKSRSSGIARPRAAASGRLRHRCGAVILFLITVAAALSPPACIGADAVREFAIGVARVDITPDYPIRLNGFGFRRDESTEVTQRIWAKALAIGSDEEGPLLLLSIDSLGVPLSLVDEVADRLANKASIRRERVALVFSHSHTTPKVNGAADTIFSSPIPPDQQQRIDRYTRELTDRIEQAALVALANRQPATLHWGVGNVGFAINRRTKGGPVDHHLPMLVARSPAGAVRAIYVTYACHCVTLSDNKISGDWAGFAQAALEHAYPEALALVSIGCGSDANPSERGNGSDVGLAAEQGAMIAAEVQRLIAGPLKPVTGEIVSEYQQIDLPLAPLPSRDQLAVLADQDSPAGYNARFQLARLERGEELPTAIDYPIQTWAFGDSLAMVFLGGEVCVDYALRLRRELDPSRLWLHGYANSFCSYIPSERLLTEGGYGGGSEIVYFALPTTLAAGLENRIVDEVRRQIPPRFDRRIGIPGTTRRRGTP